MVKSWSFWFWSIMIYTSWLIPYNYPFVFSIYASDVDDLLPQHIILLTLNRETKYIVSDICFLFTHQNYFPNLITLWLSSLPVVYTRKSQILSVFLKCVEMWWFYKPFFLRRHKFCLKISTLLTFISNHENCNRFRLINP